MHIHHIHCVRVLCRTLHGERREPVALAMRDSSTEQLQTFDWEQLQQMRQPPYGVGRDSLLLTAEAHELAEAHLVLGWPIPCGGVDFEIESRNGGAPAFFSIGDDFDGVWRLDERIANVKQRLAKEPFLSPYTQHAALQAADHAVRALSKSVPQILELDRLELARAIRRCQYGFRVGGIRFDGSYVNGGSLRRLRRCFADHTPELIRIIDEPFGVFPNGRFSKERLFALLERKGIDTSWRREKDLSLDGTTLRDLVAVHPFLQPIRDLKGIVGRKTIHNLAVGSDGRVRPKIVPFWTTSGRTQSFRGCLYALPGWVRDPLMLPSPGYRLACIDWNRQEVGIAAKSAEDKAMMEAYHASDDFYLAIGKLAGPVPREATVYTHPAERRQFKLVALSLLNGMGIPGLARRIIGTAAEARRLVELHRKAFPDYWTWRKLLLEYAAQSDILESSSGWRLLIDRDTSPGQILSFPLQSEGSEMLRTATILASDAGIKIVGSVHDSLIVEAPAGEFEDAVRTTSEAMATASRIVLKGFELTTSFEEFDGSRSRRGRSGVVWDTILDLTD